MNLKEQINESYYASQLNHSVSAAAATSEEIKVKRRATMTSQVEL